ALTTAALFPYTTLFRSVGRPPRPEPVCQRTVNFTEEQLQKLERLSAQSGRKGFRSPTFNETVRVALRLWASHEWTAQEIRSAFRSEEHTSELQSLAYLV